MQVSEDPNLEGELHSRLLIEAVTGCAIYMLDPDGYVTTWNRGAERAKGYTAPEIIGRHFSEFYTAEDRERGEPGAALTRALESGRYDTKGWRVRKDGSLFLASIIIEPIYHGDRLFGFAKVTQDISRDREDAERLAQTHRNLDIALTYMSQGLALYDASQTLILANGRLSELLGIAPGEFHPGMTLAEMLRVARFEGSHAESVRDRFRRASMTGKEQYALHEMGPDRILGITTRVLPEGGWVSTLEDVTERRRAESQLAHLAYHDVLTGLPNRVLFRERLAQAVAQSRRDIPFALLSLDVDNFKTVNDTLGHPMGDQLLKAVAQRLRSCVREMDTVARVGGDEFAIIQAGPKTAKDAEALAERVAAALREPYELEGQQVIAEGSIGVALAPSDGSDVDELLKNADMALYRAKRENRAAYSFFEPELDAQFQARRLLERDLRQALLREEFELFYQPVFHLGTGRLTSYEALLRWHHPLRGLVSPAEFIPVCEEIGLIVALGDWVLRTACRQAASWPSNVKVAVNLSSSQFKKGNLLDTVAEALAASGIGARRLELEITESVLLYHSELTIKTLHQLRSLGVQIALDDFGTGYSSISYLRSFPFDKIKIDQSFVRDLPGGEQSKAIVKAITGLGASFKMAITAEGVETAEQLEHVRAEGCTEGQGFFFSRPMPASELTRSPQMLPNRVMPAAVAGYKTPVTAKWF